MTKRREVYFEYESEQTNQPKVIELNLRIPITCPILGAYDVILAEIEVLCSRAARLSYLSPFELTQAWDPRTIFSCRTDYKTVKRTVGP